MSEDIYDLDDLIEKLENIRDGFDDGLNLPKSIYSLAKQIKSIKFYLDSLINMIPQKYKKFNPKQGEDPFFSSIGLGSFENNVLGLNDPEERRQAKERMENYSKKSSQ